MDKIKSLCEIGVALSIYLYFLGFVIVNSYLGQYGIFPEDILSSRYLAAALLFLFSICVFYALPALKRTEDQHSINVRNHVLSVGLIYLIWVGIFRAHVFKEVFFTAPGLTILLSIAIVFLFVLPCIIYSRQKDKSRFAIFFIPQAILAFGFFKPEFLWFIGFNSMTVYTTAWLLDNKAKAFKSFRLVLITIILFISNSAGFGAIVYPLIPTYLGGGKPVIVSLLVNDGTDTFGIKVGENGWSNDLKLLHKGRDAIYVETLLPTKYSCLELKENAIKAIRYTGDYKLTFWEMAEQVVGNMQQEPPKTDLIQ